MAENVPGLGGTAAPAPDLARGSGAPGAAFLHGGGELGALIRAKDWAQTPLGPPEAWPQSLKTSLGILLNSRYPMFVLWGPELITIYNDGYRPITGGKHPWALGRPAGEVWPEIWRDIERLAARALAGDPTYADDLLLFMERSGFREEVYFTFSNSPIPDESGGVGGMFCACTESTARVIAERRLRTLRDLAASTAEARTVEAACRRSTDVLTASAADVPFALVYLHQPDGSTRLEASTGLVAGSRPAPIDGSAIDGLWPVARVAASGRGELVSGLAERAGPISAGPWPEPPPAAMVLPLVVRGATRGVGAIVLGISARRPFDAEYQRWFDLLAGLMGCAIANARAAEDDGPAGRSVPHAARGMLGPLEQALAASASPADVRQSLEVAGRNSQPHPVSPAAAMVSDASLGHATPASSAPPHADSATDAASDAGLTARPGAWPGAQPGARPRIVVADDSADVRDSVAGLLAPTSRVEAVGDGLAALEAIRREPADLLIADVLMPRLDGLALLHAIRADPSLRRLPVIFVSARAGEEARVTGLEAGADDYLSKPFGARELLARVGAVLELARVRRTSEAQLARANRDLRDRVAELETLLSLIPVGIGIALDPECHSVQVNPAFATTLRLAPGRNASMTAPDGERPTGFRILDMDGRELSGRELPLQTAAREGRRVSDLELDVVHDDGRIVRLLEYAAPLLDEHGVPRGAVGAFVDITDRRRAEIRDSYLVALDDALRASDDPATIMAAATQLLGTRVDADRCTYADVETDTHRFTIPHEHTRSVPAVSLVGTWSVSAFGPRAERELRAGETLVLHDVVAEVGPGTAFTAVGIAASIVVPALREGRLVAMMALHSATPRRWRPEEIELAEATTNRCRESLARARAARVVAASEARYRIVADAMPQLVWTADPDGIVDYYSARSRAYYGIGVGRWQPMVHADDLQPTLAAWAQALRDRTPYAFEHRLRMADGRYRWHLSRAEPVRFEPDDDRVRWIGTATDIHELRETQERLRVQEEQLRGVDRRKDEFIAILAHELRNPLAPLRTGLDVLRLSHDTAGAVARVRPMMERQVTQMVRLIDDLLDVSRITSGKIQLQPEPTAVAQLVRDAMEGHRAALEAGRLTAAVSLPPEPVYVYADHARFVQILSNLLHNAIKFTDPGGTIAVTGVLAGIDRQARRLHLAVTDTGAGIPADALPHIFELFAQGHHSGGAGRVGLGIGLALARRLAELHGGRLEAASEGAERGATFTLTVPVMALDLGDAPADRDAEPGLDLAGCRVVVIDDNQDAADSLALILGSGGGEVRTAYDGESGLRLIQAFRPDAVLLDIGMPGLDGYAVCQRLRDRDPDRRLRLVAVTGFGQAHDRARALAAGFDAHLTKPADLAALHAVLAPIVRREPR